MQILLPAHHKKSSKVKNWKEIKAEASELRELVNGKSSVGYYEASYAISHAQVSHEPKRYFVVNERAGTGKLRKIFGGWCIVNPEIIRARDPVIHTEACMSFPFRKEKGVNRFLEIEVKYRVPVWGFLFPKRKKFKDLPAFILAHEIQHMEGKNIYGK